MKERVLLGIALLSAVVLLSAGCTRQRPDLIPFSSKLMFCDPDGQGNLLVHVENVGVGTSPNVHVQVVFFLSGGGTKIERPVLGTGALAPGQTSLPIPVPIPPGCYSPDCGFRITVDVLNDVIESDETNNSVDGTCIG